MDEALRVLLDDTYRAESRRVLATLIRLLGDFDLAEEALHEAFRAALEQWPRDGVPANPRAWLVSTGRFKAIDKLRRRSRFDAAKGELADRLYGESESEDPLDRPDIEDDYLRLIFTCCHPALASDARTALTLREVCGLTTEEIARAFLTDPAGAMKRTEPNPGKIDRIFAKAVERRTRGRPGLYMQSRMPREGWENGITSNPYSVFQGFAELFADFH